MSETFPLFPFEINGHRFETAEAAKDYEADLAAVNILRDAVLEVVPKIITVTVRKHLARAIVCLEEALE